MYRWLGFFVAAYLYHAVENRRPGYPRLSAFIASDKNFALFRRFGELHARLLLFKQDELAELEQKLNDLDAEEQTPYHLRSRRDDRNVARRALIAEIEARLPAYGILCSGLLRSLQILNVGLQMRLCRNIANNLSGLHPENGTLRVWHDG